MNYLYQCKNCGVKQEVIKPISASERAEVCRYCDSDESLVRVYTASSIKTSDGYKG